MPESKACKNLFGTLFQYNFTIQLKKSCIVATFDLCRIEQRTSGSPISSHFHGVRSGVKCHNANETMTFMPTRKWSNDTCGYPYLVERNRVLVEEYSLF